MKKPLYPDKLLKLQCVNSLIFNGKAVFQDKYGSWIW